LGGGVSDLIDGLDDCPCGVYAKALPGEDVAIAIGVQA